jgi:uncharacterized membrane-anchored protein
VNRIRLPLFLALCAAQLAIPLAMAYRYERTLRQGTVYRFHTEPVDPVDAFRGRYVAIRLRLVGPPQAAGDERWGTPFYVVLGRDGQGYATVRALAKDRPAGGDWLQGTLGEDVYAEWRPQHAEDTAPERPPLLGTRVELPLDRYYMEESKAPQAELTTRRFGAEGPQMDVTARVRVRHGLGAIEGLDVNGVPIERWLATVPP